MDDLDQMQRFADTLDAYDVQSAFDDLSNESLSDMSMNLDMLSNNCIPNAFSMDRNNMQNLSFETLTRNQNINFHESTAFGFEDNDNSIIESLLQNTQILENIIASQCPNSSTSPIITNTFCGAVPQQTSYQIHAQHSQNVEEIKQHAMSQTTIDPHMGEDETRVKKKMRSNPSTRMCRKDELEFLRKNVEHLQNDLSSLKKRRALPEPCMREEHVEAIRAFSMWRRIADRQIGAREKAQAENMRLRQLLERQLRVARELQKLLRKRFELAQKDPILNPATFPDALKYCEETTRTLLRDQDKFERCVMEQLEQCGDFLKQKNLIGNKDNVFDTKRSHKSSGERSMYKGEACLLPFSFEKLRVAGWDCVRAPRSSSSVQAQKVISVSDHKAVIEVTRLVPIRHIHVPMILLCVVMKREEKDKVYTCWQSHGWVDIPTTLLEASSCESNKRHRIHLQEKLWSSLERISVYEGLESTHGSDYEESCQLSWYKSLEVERQPRNTQCKPFAAQNDPIESIIDHLLNVSIQETPIFNQLLDNLLVGDSKHIT